MYQLIVLGLGFLLLFGGGYLIKKSDKAGVLGSSFASSSVTASSSAAVPSSITFNGVYSCDGAKCSDPRNLIVSEDGTVQLSTTYNNGVEVLNEIGTWTEDNEGKITIAITGTQSEAYDKPVTILLRQVTPFTLVSVNGTSYKNWGAPTFRKQDRDLE
jgi:hypothetical protein